VEQAFMKIETAISRQVVISPATAASSPPPPTPTLEYGKILNSTKIVQLHKESVSTKNKEVDIKNENHQVPKLEDPFILATKYDNVQIDDDVLNLSTTHAIIDQHLVDTKSKFPLSQNNCSDSACDKEELCDNAFNIHMPQLVNEHDVFVLEPNTCAKNKNLNEHDVFVLEPNTCAKNKNLLPVAAEKDELKLLYSLDTLSYIEFDTLCALTTLEEKFTFTDLSWLSKCTFHFVGKYNKKEEYMVHRVYIRSNMKSPFIVQQYDNFETYNSYNHVMSRSPSFVIKQHVQFQKGKQYWLQPTICPPTKLKPRMVCCQEGEDDEDMTPTDTTIDYKVRLSLHLYSNFGYNSLGSTCTCCYLIVGTNVFQSKVHQN
jgi:hypothetical protein